jgi:hypothetical protein
MGLIPAVLSNLDGMHLSGCHNGNYWKEIDIDQVVLYYEYKQNNGVYPSME